MDFIKIVIRRNAAKCNKARLRAQPDLKKSVHRGLGIISPTSKIVQEYTAREFGKSSAGDVGLWYFSDTGGLFFIASFKDGSYHLGENDVIKELF